MNKCSAPLRDLSPREFQFLKLRRCKIDRNRNWLSGFLLAY
jgi:hypothetical protein